MSAPTIEWGCSTRPIPGEDVCGDRAVVNRQGRVAIAAAVDGLGHGPEAAVAAERAVDALADGPDDDLVDLVARCHEALRPTRGAAMSVASVDGEVATWVGVGNVEGRIVRAARGRADDESLLLAAGVLGHELPPLRPASVRLARGDLLLLATDGIAPNFADGLDTGGSCEAIAARILEGHSRPRDDALVLVARYLGDSS
jgi:phosphoserine phosphatase RsbX